MALISIENFYFVEKTKQRKFCEKNSRFRNWKHVMSFTYDWRLTSRQPNNFHSVQCQTCVGCKSIGIFDFQNTGTRIKKKSLFENGLMIQTFKRSFVLKRLVDLELFQKMRVFKKHLHYSSKEKERHKIRIWSSFVKHDTLFKRYIRLEKITSKVA